MTKASPLAPKILFTEGSFRVEKSEAGLTAFWHNTLVFKSWPDFLDNPPTDALLFLRNGSLVLRNAFGEVISPESQLTPDQRALLADILSLRLPQA